VSVVALFLARTTLRMKMRLLLSALRWILNRAGALVCGIIGTFSRVLAYVVCLGFSTWPELLPMLVRRLPASGHARAGGPG
jgi:hypothetical protein